MQVSEFIRTHFQHFNASVVKDAAEGYVQHLDEGGRMFLAMAGAMSTAQIGRSLAEMIRREKVHGVCCTGANLEEDVFNLIARERYVRVPNYRELSPRDEEALRDRGLCRVTDVCIPEEEAIQPLEAVLLESWKQADEAGERRLPHEFFYEAVQDRRILDRAEADPKDCWLLAAAERNLPLFVPGWEDSTLGNVFAANVHRGEISTPTVVKSGVEYMTSMIDWYVRTTAETPLGFFQIGGGIAGDFPIAVVPLLHIDLERTEVPRWRYFCQIGDSTTSYGSYSGAAPNEKITWGKLDADSRKFMIESDASIVAPLVFAYVLGW